MATDVVLGVSEAILVLMVDVDDFDVVGVSGVVLELVEVDVVFGVSEDTLLVLIVDDFDVVGVVCVVFGLVDTGVGVGFGVVAVVFGLVVACATVFFGLVVTVALVVCFEVVFLGFGFAASSTARFSRFTEIVGA